MPTCIWKDCYVWNSPILPPCLSLVWWPRDIYIGSYRWVLVRFFRRNTARQLCLTLSVAGNRISMFEALCGIFKSSLKLPTHSHLNFSACQSVHVSSRPGPSRQLNRFCLRFPWSEDPKFVLRGIPRMIPCCSWLAWMRKTGDNLRDIEHWRIIDARTVDCMLSMWVLGDYEQYSRYVQLLRGANVDRLLTTVRT